jgi:hypothetical protein
MKKEDEEKNSIEEIKFKSQAAMEYLRTYGWAILLIIVLALSVLYSLGMINSKNFTSRAQPGSCFVVRPNGPGTTDSLSLRGTCGHLPMYVASFNGLDSYIEVPDSASLRFGSNNFSIEVWFKAPPYNSSHYGIFYSYNGSVYRAFFRTFYRTLITKAEGRIDYGYSGYYIQLGGRHSLRAIATDGMEVVTVTVKNSSIIPDDNNWHQVVFTFLHREGEGFIFILFYDGKLAAITETFTIIGSTDNSYPLRFGLSNEDSDIFNGTLANVQIYNTALTQQEVQYLYQQGLGGSPIRLQNLVGWWPLNGDAKDYSGNNNHGTLYNVTFVQNYNPP